MPLPRIDKPIFPVVVPSTGKSTHFRMMTRREEKILLMAKTSGDEADWLEAIRQVVVNCAIDQALDVDSMTSFDLEYAFVKIRAASIGSKEPIVYRDHGDDKDYKVTIDFDKVEVVFPVVSKSTIELTADTRLQLRYPRASAFADSTITKAESPEDALDALVFHCLDKVWVGNQVYDAQTTSRAELQQFVEALDVKSWDSIREFVRDMPHLSYWVEWTNSLGEERRIELRTLSDFFSFA